MFSYRHAFHAGNHADVLKHAILVHTLDYFNRKMCIRDSFERPGDAAKAGTPGWYNSAAFDKFASAEGLYAKSTVSYTHLGTDELVSTP